jgi:hypothetical protein
MTANVLLPRDQHGTILNNDMDSGPILTWTQLLQMSQADRWAQASCLELYGGRDRQVLLTANNTQIDVNSHAG